METESCLSKFNKLYCYMVGPASGQDEVNPALRLATRAGKVGLSCPLGLPAILVFGQDGGILASFFIFACLWTSI